MRRVTGNLLMSLKLRSARERSVRLGLACTRSCLQSLGAPFCFSARTAWVQKIKAASEQYIDTEKKKREKAYQGTC